MSNNLLTLAPGGNTAFNVDASGNLQIAGTLSANGVEIYDGALELQSQSGTDAGGITLESYLSAATAVSTSGAATTLSAVIPAGVLVIGWSLKVTTAIAGINSTTGTLTLSGGVSATLGTISAFTQNTAAAGASASATTAATNVVFTLSGGADNTPSSGAIQVVVWYTRVTTL